MNLIGMYQREIFRGNGGTQELFFIGEKDGIQIN